ncbi:MAG TPA: CAAX prenyl protease-related protein, partial [Phycisphaerae bacterium]
MPSFDYRKSDSAQVPANLSEWLSERPQIPYILPFLLFLLVMAPESFGHLGGVDWAALWKVWLPGIYLLKSLLAAVAIWFLWPYYTRIYWSRLHWGVIAGLIGTPLWIFSELLCQRLHLARAPDPAAFYNPDLMLPAGAAVWVFLCIRVAGPSLVVPFMEELFFRDFLMRAFIKGARFEEVAIGTFRWTSFLGMSLLFGVNHGYDYFVPGVLYGLLMGVLLIRTKS